MKKGLILIIFILLLILPVTAQADDPGGAWIGFLGSDFEILRFDPDSSELYMIDTMGDTYTEFSGTYQAVGDTIIYNRSDGKEDQMVYSVTDGKMVLDSDWFGERTFTMIDKSFYPEDPEDSPFIGENREYMIDMTEEGGIRILEYLGDAETLEIPSSVFGIPVTEIGENAVCYKEGLKQVILPDGIKKIARQAFEEDQDLEEIRLPATLESIGNDAFRYCYKLREIVIPDGVKVIEDGTFWECTFLKKAMLPESIEEIMPEAFYGCSSVVFHVSPGSYAEQFCREYKLPYVAADGVPQDKNGSPDDRLIGTWIEFHEGEFSFFRFSPNGNVLTILESSGYYPDLYTGAWESDGKTITYYRTSEYVTEGYSEEIPYYFSGEDLVIDWYFERVCMRIDDSYFPEDIGSSPYLGEDKEYWITLLEDRTIRIDGYVGNEETVIVPDTVFGFPVTAIRDTAFMSVDGMKRAVVPNGVTFIGYQAFSYNDDLESVELPDTLQTLEYSAFMCCHALKEIVIPEGVTFLDSDTFWSCDSLTKVTLPASLEAAEIDAFDSSAAENVIFTVKEGSFAENYCREEGFTCVTAEGKQLTGGTLPVDEPADGPADGPGDESFEEEETMFVSGDEELYNEAMSLFREEKYYSARMAFIESGYGDWEEMAEKCVQPWPSDGEIWRDRSQWLQDMELKIVVEQPEDTGMFVRLFKDNAPVSYLFLSGSDTVTVRLPGNGYYVIKNGVGHTWYGMNEAFGPEGSYETMTFDDQGADKVYLKSYYAYTLSINVSTPDLTGDDVGSRSEDWDSFILN